MAFCGASYRGFSLGGERENGLGLFAKSACGELRFRFIGNEINTNGARHPMALSGERENGLGLFAKSACGELQFRFIGNEINTNGARHPITKVLASVFVPFVDNYSSE